jgi:hypothetical protein
MREPSLNEGVERFFIESAFINRIKGMSRYRPSRPGFSYVVWNLGMASVFWGEQHCCSS